MSYTTDAARWRALSIRDPAADGKFIYTVKSTKVYCRPTCPARLARRANVGFCTTPAEAASLGYRACKRCKPDAASAEDPQEKAVAKACALIEEALRPGDAKALRLQDLARNVRLTPRYFHKIFKDRMGVTPKEWAMGKMAEKERGMGELGTPSLVLNSTLDVEGLNSDAFAFNELVGLDRGVGVPMDGGVDVLATTEQAISPLDPFGEPLDVNTSMLTWDTFAPDYLNSEFRYGMEWLSGWADATSAWESHAAITKTTATFEQDAALILDTGYIPGLNDGMHLSTSGYDGLPNWT